jgi:hypothetical protein
MGLGNYHWSNGVIAQGLEERDQPRDLNEAIKGMKKMNWGGGGDSRHLLYKLIVVAKNG